ncbi:LOW QUALITY PROTEIN: transmembrane protease serine 4-like [Macrobrachium nipponense]|uniref:LOW QUALITY PROTEIN: transmembrane protease serine 4-like n=1 Tax=Macrobrachium nipponense TaxID=159736 RepID=UPI0030C83837
MFIRIILLLCFVALSCATIPFLPSPVKRSVNFTHTEECGVAHPGIARIVGGDRSSLDKWPWLVSLRSFPNKIFCGGSILTSRHVLTSAHCMKPFRNLLFLTFVVAGEKVSSSGNGRTFSMPTFTRNTKRAPFYADVVVVLLSGDLAFDTATSPVCLPPPDWVPTTGQAVTVIGWGRMWENGLSAWFLREVTVNIIEGSKCKEVFEKDWTTGMICAGAPGKDACQGDSGGPLLLKTEDGTWVLVGLVSFGMGCAREDIPGVYLNIAPFLDFVNASLLLT